MNGFQDIDAMLDEARALQKVSPIQHTHDDVLDIIKRCDLPAFIRDPAVQRLYETFSQHLNAQCGGVSQYLLKRLGWTETDVKKARATGRYFSSDIGDELIRICENDWSYSVPRDYEHMLVWTLLPIVDWSDAAPFVQTQGISGRVGLDVQRVDAPGNKDTPVCEEIIDFVMNRWPTAAELLWFVNPVKLQSVPGLAHIHVLVRKSSAL